MLDDIEIHFNHYISFEEAKNKWDERKRRINYDNIYIVMYDRGGLSYYDLKSLENINCNNIIVFSVKLHLVCSL